MAPATRALAAALLAAMLLAAPVAQAFTLHRRSSSAHRGLRQLSWAASDDSLEGSFRRMLLQQTGGGGYGSLPPPPPSGYGNAPPPPGGYGYGAIAFPLPIFYQCGGMGGGCKQFTCSSDAPFPETFCTGGNTCQRQNEYYWQCLPPGRGFPKHEDGIWN